MGMTRDEAIRILTYNSNVIHKTRDGRSDPREVEALDMAIASLKADEAYNLMYEGVEVFTKEEVATMFTELKSEIEELDSRAGYDGGGMPTFSTDYIRKKKVNELVQQKINALRGNEDGK